MKPFQAFQNYSYGHFLNALFNYSTPHEVTGTFHFIKYKHPYNFNHAL